MIGIVGASGLVGRNLWAHFAQQHAEQHAEHGGVLGTYCDRQRDGLIHFDLQKGEFGVFAGCRAVIVSIQLPSIDHYRRDVASAYDFSVTKTIALLDWLRERKIKPVFLSSEQVFDGAKGLYEEDDEPNPLNLYGRYKLEVERFMQERLDDYLIFRLSKTYSKDPQDGGVYLEILDRLRRGEKQTAAFNQVYNPTDVALVCRFIRRSLELGLSGLYHLADRKVMSRLELAREIAAEHGIDHRGLVEGIDYRTLGLVEPRPLDTSMRVERIHRLCGGA
ncbi:MAG: sugar nucleotide-binding protein [Pseudomonadota bacterium]